MKGLLLTVLCLCMSACSSSYQHSQLRVAPMKFDPSSEILISTPADGYYGQIQYRDSGRMTAAALKAAFIKYAFIVNVIESCHFEQCIDAARAKGARYYVRPEILRWEERATEWSGKPDRIEINIVIFDVETGGSLENSSYSGKSTFFTFGGDHPQDLLDVPSGEYVRSLYQ